jgi:hypothetical protein
MAKIDRNGNIIRSKKEPEKQLSTVKTKSEPETIPEKATDPQTQQTIPIFYDFILHCATLTPNGMDMGFVCENCPFRTTTCVDTMILPDENQMIAIANILMRKEGV